MSDYDNLPAFPTEVGLTPPGETGYHQTGNSTAQFHGMTLRDYFAAKALTNIDLTARQQPWAKARGVATVAEAVAQYAYELADAMLEARKP